MNILKNQGKQVEEALALLGKNKEQISNTLRSMGIKGRRFGSNKCPVAHYFQEVLHKELSVSTDTLIIYGFFKWDVFILPKEVQDWIVDFDTLKLPEFLDVD